MLQSMGLQRVGHNWVIEQEQINIRKQGSQNIINITAKIFIFVTRREETVDIYVTSLIFFSCLFCPQILKYCLKFTTVLDLMK